MKKTNMLKKNYEFKQVFKNGKYYGDLYLEGFLYKNKENKNFLGIGISNKLAKAVKRNYLKRIIRESYNQLENQIKEGYSIIFIWNKRTDIEKASFNNVFVSMTNILKKAKVIKNENE